MPTVFSLSTPHRPGPVAIIDLIGDQAIPVTAELTSKQDWPTQKIQWVRFAQIDSGLAVAFSPKHIQLMPHGGPFVVDQLLAWLEQHDITPAQPNQSDSLPAQLRYPEAESAIEADMLAAIALAASPLAIDYLAIQPNLWLDYLSSTTSACVQNQNDPLSQIDQHTQILSRLLSPPTVVLMGPPNAGKSSLANRLIGQTTSIVHDTPGTTRDYVGSAIELPLPNFDPIKHPQHRLAIHFYDTPGLRESDDAVEQAAITVAKNVLERADLLISMRSPEQSFLPNEALGRSADLYVLSKADLIESKKQTTVTTTQGLSPDNPLPISSQQDLNLDHLIQRIIQHFALDALPDRPLWRFSKTLAQASALTFQQLGDYVSTNDHQLD